MEILRHPLCVTELDPPADMRDGSCEPLPIAICTDEHGMWSISFWKPDTDELAKLQAGGAIALWVRATGRQHPVVGLGIQPADG